VTFTDSTVSADSCYPSQHTLAAVRFWKYRRRQGHPVPTNSCMQPGGNEGKAS